MEDYVGWLIAIIVAIALIYFMIVSSGFRYLIIGIGVLGAIAIYAWIEYEKKESERRQQIATAQERVALSAISTTDIALDNVQLMKESSRWVLKGNVTNNSKYRLGSLGFIVRIEDCPPQKECITIGQESVRAFVSVPPGQMRAFSSYAIDFKGMPAAKTPRWRYEITEIRAD
jgi:hypothetical protein